MPPGYKNLSTEALSFKLMLLCNKLRKEGGNARSGPKRGFAGVAKLY
jgi:hypothetical protein